MSYQVLARKWRPQNFKQMVGQEHVLKALIHALDAQRLHHAYLFTGTRGVGKTTIGRILAKCLSCHVSITSEPCNECSACVGIKEGRYVDLIEIDAASRTKVEDMRELLDNVQYAPTEGRFKIYLIDEVHMLSQSSFNALLKTLEEPPEHVKFLFATTDPQKLPVTILSRCLQFNLKNMSPDRIVAHLQHILGEEEITYEAGSLWALARAADGSMRDALSLTDQAIAYGNRCLNEADVNNMLGTVDQKRIYRLLFALVEKNAPLMLNEIAALAEFSPDYTNVLASLASILHRVALEQAVPGVTDNALGDQEDVRHYAGGLSAEDVQLYYQIALVSRKDLAMTPDPRAGLEMALLRMLAFQPTPPESDQRDALPHSADTEPAHVPEPASIDPLESNSVPHNERDQVKKNSDVSLAVPEANPAIGAEPEPDVNAERLIPSRQELLNRSDPSIAPKTPSPSETRLSDHADGANENLAAIDAVGDVAGVSRDLADNGRGSEGPEPFASALPFNEVHASETAVQTAAPEARELAPTAEVTGAIDWPRLAPKLGLSGMTQNLLFNTALVKQSESLTLQVDEGHFRLLNRNHEARIRKALEAHFGESIKVHFASGLSAEQETPMMWRERKQREFLQHAISSMKADPKVQDIIETFGGRLLEESIKTRREIK